VQRENSGFPDVEYGAPASAREAEQISFEHEAAAMTSAPIGLEMHRRAALQARTDRARRLPAQADARDNAESVAELRAFVEVMGKESGQGRDALAFALRIERGDAASLAAIRKSVAQEFRTVQA